MKTGVQCFHNYLRLLDSGFRRNDDPLVFSTFYGFTSIASYPIRRETSLVVWSFLRRSYGWSYGEKADFIQLVTKVIGY